MGERCRIHDLVEHSARLGGARFHYYVLLRDLFLLYRAFSWNSLTEKFKYISIEDSKIHTPFLDSTLLELTSYFCNFS